VLVDFGIFQDGEDQRERNRSLGPVEPSESVPSYSLMPISTTVAACRCWSPTASPAACMPRQPHWNWSRSCSRTWHGSKQEDTRRINRRRRRAGERPIRPLFTSQQVGQLLQRARPMQLGQMMDSRHRRAGPSARGRPYSRLGQHRTSCRHQGSNRCLVFSGDLGPGNAPILRDPEPPLHGRPGGDGVDLRRPQPAQHTSAAIAEFKRIVEQAAANGDRVIIPAFAVGRTQTVLYYLAEAVREGRLSPDFPIYLDSPMATRATQIVSAHPELFDDETRRLREHRQLEADLRGLRIIESVPESMALNDSDHPCIIISASGMCEGGRVIHHLKHNLWRRNAHVLLVGLHGRRIRSAASCSSARSGSRYSAKTIAVRADIHRIEGFSAHAGHDELLNWLARMAASRPRVRPHPRRGRWPAEALAKPSGERFGIICRVPGIGRHRDHRRMNTKLAELTAGLLVYCSTSGAYWLRRGSDVPWGMPSRQHHS
jgi:metallo-beta-lactamase family protein